MIWGSIRIYLDLGSTLIVSTLIELSVCICKYTWLKIDAQVCLCFCTLNRSPRTQNLFKIAAIAMSFALQFFATMALSSCCSCMAASCDSDPSLCMLDETSLLQVAGTVELASQRVEKLGATTTKAPSAAEKAEKGAESELEADEVSAETEESTLMDAEKAARSKARAWKYAAAPIPPSSIPPIPHPFY